MSKFVKIPYVLTDEEGAPVRIKDVYVNVDKIVTVMPRELTDSTSPWAKTCIFTDSPVMFNILTPMELDEVVDLLNSQPSN